MSPKDNTKHKLAECLHLFADIIANGRSNEIFTTLEKALLMAKKDMLLGREGTSKRPQSKSRMANTVPAQKSLAFQENSSALSIKEFGRDVTSDIEFPTRHDLVDFAIVQGVQVLDRDNKAAIRKRLLSKAELRNMDELVGQVKEQ